LESLDEKKNPPTPEHAQRMAYNQSWSPALVTAYVTTLRQGEKNLVAGKIYDYIRKNKLQDVPSEVSKVVNGFKA